MLWWCDYWSCWWFGIVSPKTFDQFISSHIDSDFYKPDNPLAYMVYGGAVGFLWPSYAIYHGLDKLQSICNPDLKRKA